MPMQYASPIVRVGSAFAFVLVLAACTPGGNFDPTEWVNLDTKKKIPGDREPLFPNGVPGAETGVPPDLVKGYQPPPEAPSVADAPPPAAVAAAVGAVEPKPPSRKRNRKPSRSPRSRAPPLPPSSTIRPGTLSPRRRRRRIGRRPTSKPRRRPRPTGRRRRPSRPLLRPRRTGQVRRRRARIHTRSIFRKSGHRFSRRKCDKAKKLDRIPVRPQRNVV